MVVFSAWDPNRELWRLSTGRSLTLDEIAQWTVQTDSKQARRYLWNLQDLQHGPSSREELRAAADLVRRNLAHWRGSRVAILVSGDLHYGLARMFQALIEGEGIDYEVFRDEAAALAWLSESSAS